MDSDQFSAVLSTQTDLKTWQIPVEHLKGTQNWSVPWTDRDDSALLVGIWKHGFGCWEEIQSDESLGLKGKFFLEAEKDKKEAKEAGTPTVEDSAKDGQAPAVRGRGKKQSAPGPVHLVRRGDYLLLTLIDSEAASKFRKDGPAQRERQPGKVQENGPGRPRKPKIPSALASTKSAKASPAPSSKEDRKQQNRGSAQPSSKVQKPVQPKPLKSEENSSSDSSSDEDSDASVLDTSVCKEMLRPVKRELKDLRGCDKLPREEKVRVLSRCLKSIGDRIGLAVKEVPAVKREKQEKHLWRLASGFWPNEGVKWSQIKAMCKSSSSPL